MTLNSRILIGYSSLSLENNFTFFRVCCCSGAVRRKSYSEKSYLIDSFIFLTKSLQITFNTRNTSICSYEHAKKRIYSRFSCKHSVNQCISTVNKPSSQESTDCHMRGIKILLVKILLVRIRSVKLILVRGSLQVIMKINPLPPSKKYDVFLSQFATYK